MRLQFETKMTCPRDVVWREMSSIATLDAVSWPLLRLIPMGNPLGDRWQEGKTYHFQLKLFYFIPLHIQEISFVQFDDVNFTYQTQERGGPISDWRHRVTIELTSGGCLLRDEIHFQAGLSNVSVWCFSQLLYRVRRLRLRRRVK